MTLDPLVDLAGLLLVVLVLGVAAWTTMTRDAFASVVGFIAYGLLLTLVWVRLKAVDVALTEAAIGGGATGVLLLGAVARLRRSEVSPSAQPVSTSLKAVAALFSATVAIALAAVVLSLPDPAPTLAPAAVAQLGPSGLGNAVTGALLVYRSVDTLLESIVLPLALIGIWSLAPDRFWGGRPGRRIARDSYGALPLLGQLLPPLGIVLSVYIVWVGADAPGGKFQGGTILAAMWVLAMLAGLVDAPAIGRRWLRLLLVAGSGLFMLIGFAGWIFADSFLDYPEGYAKALILLIEGGMTLSIAAALGLMVMGPPERTDEA